MPNNLDQSWIDQPSVYQIIIKGRLDASWADWFEGLAISVSKDGSGTVFTSLTGSINDQAVLHGLLARIRDLGLTLFEVRRLPPGSLEGANE